MGSISHYIKEIGRGKDGARPLTRAQSADLFGQVLDGAVTDLEVGAFCLAMRIKGETPDEMAGFLDATYMRMACIPAGDAPVIVLPSYNGARKLPVLTPLLALLLAREGLPVLVHGTATENRQTSAADVLALLGVAPMTAADLARPITPIAAGRVAFAPTELLCPGLKRLLDVRRTVGLRNPAHSLVKLMNPVAGPAVLVGSYTHPEYAVSMAAVFELMGSTAMLLRGTEGEVVADPRRAPRMQGFIAGTPVPLEEGVKGTLPDVPALPADIGAQATAQYTRDVLEGRAPRPDSIARQVAHLVHLASQARNTNAQPMNTDTSRTTHAPREGATP